MENGKDRGMRRPRLTQPVIDGLREIRALVIAELQAGEQGSFAVSNGGTGVKGPERGLEYLSALIDWNDDDVKR